MISMGGLRACQAGGGRVFSGGLFGPLASVVGEAGVLLGLRQPHQVHHGRTWAASARPDEHGQDSESKQNRRFAQERKKVHGLGRLSAKVGKPEVDVCRLQGVPRGTTNKYDVKRLRAQGLVPAVLMPFRDTQGVGTIHLSLKDAEIERLLRRHISEYAKSRLIRLVVPEGAGDHFRGWTDTEGEREGERVCHAIIRSFSFHPVTSQCLNVSLQRCPPGHAVKVRVPVSIIGQDACPALKRNGYLYPVRPFVDCVVSSDDIPASIEYDVSKMNIGNSVRIRDLEFQDSITRLLGKSTDPAETLYKMIKL